MERTLPSPVICLDWFSFSIHADSTPKALPPQFEEEVLGGNNIFAKRAIYRYRGAKVLTILSKPKSKILAEDICLVEVANRWLYDFCELESILATMFPIYRVSNMSRIDICADFECDEQTMETIQRLSSGAYYVGGKKLGLVYYEEGKERVPYCLNFGSVKSDIKWKLYNKTKEIAATSPHCTKPWIKAYWSNHGLDYSKMWRLEVSYHGEKFSDSHGNYIGTCDLYTTDLHRILFAEFYKFRFKVKERLRSRKQNDKEVPFLDIPETQEEYIDRPRAIVCGHYDDSDEARLLLDRLVRSYDGSVTLSHAVKMDTVLLIRRICSEYGYFGYVRERHGWDFETANPRKVLRG